MLLPIMNGTKEELKNDLTSLKETVDQQYEVIKCLQLAMMLIVVVHQEVGDV